MAKKATTLHDNLGNDLLPVTNASITFMDNGNSVQSEIQDLKSLSLYKGHFTNINELYIAYPNNISNPLDRKGWYAIVGETDTIWVWDIEGNKWSDSGVASSNVNSVNGNTGDVILTGGNINATATINDTSKTELINVHLNDIYSELDNKVDLDSSQLITGTKIFTEVIGLANTSEGTIDQIKHINSNFLITSGTGQNLLNIDEGLETISAFNRELAYEDEIQQIQGNYATKDELESVNSNALKYGYSSSPNADSSDTLLNITAKANNGETVGNIIIKSNEHPVSGSTDGLTFNLSTSNGNISSINLADVVNSNTINIDSNGVIKKITNGNLNSLYLPSKDGTLLINDEVYNFSEEEYEKQLNLISEELMSMGGYNIYWGYIYGLKPNTTYTFKTYSGYIGGSNMDLENANDGTLIQNIVTSWNLNLQNQVAKFTTGDNVNENQIYRLHLKGTYSGSTFTRDCMLVEGDYTFDTIPSYQEYNGEIVHREDLGVLLWRNGSPNAEFIEQTITLNDNMDNYSYIKIVHTVYGTGDRTVSTFKVGGGVTMGGSNAWYLGSGNYAYRILCRYCTTNLTGTTLGFNECVKIDYSSSTAPTISMDNTRMIPIEIYGIKV